MSDKDSVSVFSGTYGSIIVRRQATSYTWDIQVPLTGPLKADDALDFIARVDDAFRQMFPTRNIGENLLRAAGTEEKKSR
jgi:hypothetical protein